MKWSSDNLNDDVVLIDVSQGFIQKEIFGGEVGVAVSRTVTPPPIKHWYGLMIMFSDVHPSPN